MLGNMYLYGEGVAEDDGKALLWLQRAARRSDDMAQNWLGIMYASGQGVPQDLALAAHYYRLAAENGNHAAQTNLAMAYEDGRGVAQDSALARLGLNAPLHRAARPPDGIWNDWRPRASRWRG
jgi:TPR repeat protein